MISYLVPVWALWSILVVFLFLIGGLIYYIFKFYGVDKCDMLLFIDRNNRFKIHRTHFFNKKEINIDNSKYFLAEDTGLLNKKGKALYIFSEGKPQPLKLSYNSSKWLDGKTLLSMINNDLVQMMVKPKASSLDTFLMVGAIGGIIAGLSSVVILLLQLGVIGG